MFFSFSPLSSTGAGPRTSVIERWNNGAGARAATVNKYWTDRCPAIQDTVGVGWTQRRGIESEDNFAWEVVVVGLRNFVIFVLCAATSACGSGAKNTAGTGGSGGSGGGGGMNVDAAVNGISCDPFTACGGSIVGTWRVVSSCGVVSSPACASSERITAQSSAPQTTYTFASDGTFTLTASGDLTEALRYPLACLGALTDAGIPQACADLERAFLAPQTGDAGTQTVEVTSASCAAAANETCACTAVIRYGGTQTTSGSYTTSGSQLTLVASADGGVRDAGADPYGEYCVAGNTLTLRFINSTSDWVTRLTR
jgi:hypothetical protein